MHLCSHRRKQQHPHRLWSWDAPAAQGLLSSLCSNAERQRLGQLPPGKQPKDLAQPKEWLNPARIGPLPRRPVVPQQGPRAERLSKFHGQLDEIDAPDLGLGLGLGFSVFVLAFWRQAELCLQRVGFWGKSFYLQLLQQILYLKFRTSRRS